MLPEMKERGGIKKKVREKHITSRLKSRYTYMLCIFKFLQTEKSPVRPRLAALGVWIRD